MSSPSFYGEGHTPVEGDPKVKIANKILGTIIDKGNGVNASPSFYSPIFHTPSRTDTYPIVLQKILGALIDTGVSS